MDSNNINITKLNEIKGKINQMISKNYLEIIKSKYILNKVFEYLHEKKLILKIIKYNKKIQNRIDIDIKTYKEYSELYTQIELEIIPAKNKNVYFINFPEEEDKSNFHIYFDDNTEEQKNTYISKKEKVNKIKIIIDPPS